MGKVSAADYYKRLDEINSKYYKNKSKYLDDYNSLAEKIYEGLKKAQEDDVSNALELEERLKAVKEAKDALNNAEKQRVSVYSGAAGFHTEKDSAEISKAQEDLNNSETDLKKLLYNLGYISANKVTGGVSSILKNIDVSKLTSSLPDLSALKIPTAKSGRTASGKTAKSYTINIEYKAGDIIINGNADDKTISKISTATEKQIKTLFNKYIKEYLSKANLDRMTGG